MTRSRLSGLGKEVVLVPQVGLLSSFLSAYVLQVSKCLDLVIESFKYHSFRKMFWYDSPLCSEFLRFLCNFKTFFSPDSIETREQPMLGNPCVLSLADESLIHLVSNLFIPNSLHRNLPVL
jgi:hypothetical protein